MKSSILVVAALTVLAFPVYAQTTEGSFTLKTSTAEGMLTPTLTWDTNALGCRASGDSEWEGDKPGSGEVTLSPRPTSQPRAFALVCSTPEDSAAFLTWTPPTENTDGTAITNLAGYRVYWGEDASTLDKTAQIDDPAATSYGVTELAPRTWYFGVRAFTDQGAESALSNIVSRTTRAAVEWSQQTAIKVPKAPGVVVQAAE